MLNSNVDFKVPRELVMRNNSIEYDKPEYRDDFMRDRDRVLYSTAFRRLAGKTQIYTIDGNDHRRNRLTHTLEVAQIARTISKALRLDENLTEAIALGHDLGHAPFGHAGEKILHEIMVCDSTISLNKSIKESPFNRINEKDFKDIYGFKHTVQSVRVATLIEDGYGENGLNLTNFTLWGMMNHSGIVYKEGTVDSKYIDPDYKNDLDKYICHDKNEAWSFEAFVVREADEIAQWHHDMEDALYSNAMTPLQVANAINDNLSKMIENNIEMGKEISKIISELSNSETHINLSMNQIITRLSRIIVNTLVTHIIKISEKNMETLWKEFMEGKSRDEKIGFFNNSCYDELGTNKVKIKDTIGYITFQGRHNGEDTSLRSYPKIIKLNIHHSQEVERMNAKGQYIIKKLFEAYSSHPQQLSDKMVVKYMKKIIKYSQEEILFDEKIISEIKGALENNIGAVRDVFEKVLVYRTEGKMPTKLQIELMRSICDYIASMTDGYAIKEYNNLYE